MQGWPTAQRGEVIGLLGGSFDPPHAGHVHITRTALTRFALDRVWWLVSPGNPLKAKGPAPLDQRMTAARAIMDAPDVVITDLETRLHTRYTAETLRGLRRRYPGVRFVWLMGADNLADFHRWQDWRWIMSHVPVGVLARPGNRTEARNSRAARLFRSAQLPEWQAARLGRRQAPAWCFLNLPMSPASSTSIRDGGGWAGVGASVKRRALPIRKAVG